MAAFPGLLYKSFYNSEITDNRRIIFEITSAEKNNNTGNLQNKPAPLNSTV